MYDPTMVPLACRIPEAVRRALDERRRTTGETVDAIVVRKVGRVGQNARSRNANAGATFRDGIGYGGIEPRQERTEVTFFQRNETGNHVFLQKPGSNGDELLTGDRRLVSDNPAVLAHSFNLFGCALVSPVAMA